MKSGGMMKNDNRNDRRTSGPAKGTEKTKATGKANAAGKTKVTAGKENRVPVGQGREKTAVKKKSGLCPVADKCGGCSWINKPYVEQLKNKEKQLKELLAPFCKVEGVIPMEHPEHYRNKVHAVFGENRYHDAISGIYEQKSHRIVPVDSCLIENANADEIIVSIRGLLKSFHIRPYNEDTGYGLLRHVLIRTGHVTGQIMVVLVLASPILPSKNNFVKALLKLHPEITTVVINVNNRNTSMVLGDKEHVIYGKGYIEDELCGKRFRISPRSFYQVNPVQTEILYGKALEYAGLTGKETVVDAYCGTGTIGMIASDKAAKVIGVELNADAVRDARNNAKANQIRNIQFYQNDAGKFLVEMAGQGAKVDVVLMDPPRSGSTEEFMNSVAQIGPERIVYVSCNPETLVRDLKYFKKKGYRVAKGVGVDMFPFTEHVETVVLLSHKKPDGHINVKVEFGEGEGKVPLDNIAKRAETYKPKERVTYKMIKEYIEAKYGFKVHTAYIAEVKRDLGLPMYDAPNAVEELKQPRKHPTAEKVEAIKDALKHFEVI
ncbi:23S rRNA (uracil(1939)-C(5))-methyltransferase RlmD [Clostridium sp. AF46-9NS]|nr:23S rRNA (uracil(1939)-C(5))-methyltransferase RlmD [Clostridium sp. AF46-9NS]